MMPLTEQMESGGDTPIQTKKEIMDGSKTQNIAVVDGKIKMIILVQQGSTKERQERTKSGEEKGTEQDSQVPFSLLVSFSEQQLSSLEFSSWLVLSSVCWMLSAASQGTIVKGMSISREDTPREEESSKNIDSP